MSALFGTDEDNKGGLESPSQLKTLVLQDNFLDEPLPNNWTVPNLELLALGRNRIPGKVNSLPGRVHDKEEQPGLLLLLNNNRLSCHLPEDVPKVSAPPIYVSNQDFACAVCV